MAATEYSSGQTVEVNDDGMWCKATLEEKRPNGKWKVQFPAGYDGYFKENKIRVFDEEQIEKEAEEEQKRLQAILEKEKKKSAAQAETVVTRTPEERALAFKEKGNNFFKKNKYETASNMYTRAIEVCPNNPVFYNNRAMAELKLENYLNVIADCTKALSLDPSSTKAHFRRGCARMKMIRNLDDWQNTMDDFNSVRNESLVAQQKQQMGMIKEGLLEYLRKQEAEKNKSSASDNMDIDEID